MLHLHIAPQCVVSIASSIACRRGRRILSEIPWLIRKIPYVKSVIIPLMGDTRGDRGGEKLNQVQTTVHKGSRDPAHVKQNHLSAFSGPLPEPLTSSRISVVDLKMPFYST